MKILILSNFFNQDFHNFIKFLKKKLFNYKIFKLKLLIRKLKKIYGKDIEIKVYTNNHLRHSKNIDAKVVQGSDFRINMDREEFLKIKKKVINGTKSINSKLFQNLREAKFFHIDGVFLGKLMEYSFSLFLKNIFGEYELINKILITEKYDKCIFFNYNKQFIEFYKDLNKKFQNLEFFKHSILKKTKEFSLLFFIKYIIEYTGIFIKIYLNKTSQLTKTSNKSNEKNIVFISNTKNQFNSIKAMFGWFKKEENYNSILFSNKYTVPIKRITKLIKFLIQIRSIWLKEKNSPLNNLKYDSILLIKMLKDYYKFELFFTSVRIYNNLYHFKKMIRLFSPVLVILTDELRAEARLYTNFCKLNKIPTVYIPHASCLPIYDEFTESNDFSYITTSGNSDKKYLIKKGISSEKIFVTGRSSWDDLYKGTINHIYEVRDMFSKRTYKFEPNKFTILYATSRVGMKSSAEFDKKVFLGLKELNLLNNLVIKIHPAEFGDRQRRVLNELDIHEPVIVKDYNILELINSSNLLLSRRSTTILDSFITGTPVIVLDFINLIFFESGHYNFMEEKDIITVRTQKAFKEAVGKLMNDNDFNNKYSLKLKEIAKYYSHNNESSTALDNNINLILKIIRN